MLTKRSTNPALASVEPQQHLPSFPPCWAAPTRSTLVGPSASRTARLMQANASMSSSGCYDAIRSLSPSTARLKPDAKGKESSQLRKPRARSRSPLQGLGKALHPLQFHFQQGRAQFLLRLASFAPFFFLLVRPPRQDVHPLRGDGSAKHPVFFQPFCRPAPDGVRRLQHCGS